MEGLLSTFPPFGLCGPSVPGGGWGKRSRIMTPQGLNYLDLCRALQSQVSPSVLPLPKKANTRDCGVQVNAKVHRLIQCSLGPKTLFSRDGESPLPRKAPQSPVNLADGTTPARHLRFLRPVSIYSPVFDRRLFLKGHSLGENDERHATVQEDSMESAASATSDQDTGFHLASRGSVLQFLEQRYGFFHCKKCNIRWESAYVWCISGTSKVYFKQLCRKCQVGFNPYRVESILCRGCSQTSCTCEKKQRHINMKRPHRQDLCGRCKDVKISCDATYSFKYIV